MHFSFPPCVPHASPTLSFVITSRFAAHEPLKLSYKRRKQAGRMCRDLQHKMWSKSVHRFSTYEITQRKNCFRLIGSRIVRLTGKVYWAWSASLIFLYGVLYPLLNGEVPTLPFLHHLGDPCYRTPIGHRSLRLLASALYFTKNSQGFFWGGRGRGGGCAGWFKVERWDTRSQDLRRVKD
jgi:hypothetical protein